jgi:hypothetical protein
VLASLNALAAKSYKSSTYDQAVHFIHIYTIEAHPLSPDPSPYSGTVWEHTSSAYNQPKVYADRVTAATAMQALLTGNQIILVDELTPLPRNNPVWTSYGPAPNGAYLIGMDAKIKAVQPWVNATTMESEIITLDP